MTIDVSTIDARRAEASHRLALLKRQRGAALLDDTAFDQAEIDALIDELDMLDAAQIESVKRTRDGIAEGERQQRRAMVAGIASENTRREEAVRRAEQSAKEFGAALADIMASSAACVTLMRSLGVKPSIATGKQDMEFRFAVRLATALLPVTSTRRRFGPLVFPEPLGADDWVADERRAWASAFAAIDNMEL